MINLIPMKLASKIILCLLVFSVTVIAQTNTSIVGSLGISDYNKIEILQKIALIFQFRPLHQRLKKKYIPRPRMPTPRSYFAYRMKNDPQNEIYSKIQYHNYEKKYNIGEYELELPFCVVAIGRNLYTRNKVYEKFINSVAVQNYTNFRLIYIDDASEDNTYQVFLQKIKRDYPKLYQKSIIVENSQRKYALQNKYEAIHKYCQKEDIVIDIDADDQLIGKQVFKLINAVYQKNKQLWVVYANNISFEDNLNEPIQGSSTQIPRARFEKRNLRSRGFNVINLRSFRRDLFLSIPKTYFINKENQFFKWSSDLFIYSALLELSGYDRVQYVNEMVYFYNRENRFVELEEKMIDTIDGTTRTPFLQIDTPMKDAATVDPNELTQNEVQKLVEKVKDTYRYLESKRTFLSEFSEEYVQIVQKMLKKFMIIHPMLKSLQAQGSLPKAELEKINFAYKLLISSNEVYEQLQDYYYQQTLKFSTNPNIPQGTTPFCLIGQANSHDLLLDQKQSTNTLFSTLANQYYRNFRLIIGIRGSQKIFEKENFLFYISQNYPSLIGKLEIMFLSDQRSNLSQKLLQKCQGKQIVIPITMNLSFVGNFFFNILDRIYYCEKNENKQNLYIVRTNSFKIERRKIFEHQNITLTALDTNFRSNQISKSEPNKFVAFQKEVYKKFSGILRKESKIEKYPFINKRELMVLLEQEKVKQIKVDNYFIYEKDLHSI